MAQTPEDSAPMPKGHREDILLKVNGGTLDGYVEPADYGPQAKLEHVEVDEDKRGTGMGAALVREFAQRAVQGGAVVLSAEVAVVSLAKTMAHVFGRQNMVCGLGKANAYLDFSYEQALVALAEAEAMTDRHEAQGLDTPDTAFSAVELRVPLIDHMVEPYLYAEDPVQHELFGHTGAPDQM